jgi:sugar lactone lactonase YvrE
MLVLTACRAAAAEDAQVRVVVDDHPNLSVPFGLDFFDDGSLAVADFGGQRICRVSADGVVDVLAGDGQAGHRDGAAAQAQFNAPHNVVVLDGGDLLVSDTSNHCVRRINLATRDVTTVAGRGGIEGFAGDGAVARGALCSQAYHVYPTAKGFLLADLGNRRIREVEGDLIRTIAGTGESAAPADGALAREAPLVDPRAVAQDGEGNIWILERSGHALRMIDPAGHIRTVAGTGAAGAASDGPALQCTLNGPKFLWIEVSGDVLIADTENHCIRRYSRRDATLTTIAGTGIQGEGPPGMSPTQTALHQPHGAAMAPDGTLYISDSINGRLLAVPAE